MKFLNIFIYLLFLSSFDWVLSKTDDNKGVHSASFGHYKMSVLSIENCEDMYKKDPVLNWSLTYHTTTDGQYVITGTFNITKEHKDVKGLYVLKLWKNGEYKNFFSKTSTSPCTDVVMGMALVKPFNSNSRCVIKKGFYKMPEFNVNDFAYKTMGKTFFYQKIFWHCAFFTKNGATFCMNGTVESTPTI